MKMISLKSQKIILGILFLLIIGWGCYENFSDKKQLIENSETTVGKVIDLKFNYKTTYVLYYDFYVDNKKIRGKVYTSAFDIKKIKGKEFEVTYSKNDPEINDIDIGKYNEYKKYRPFYSE